MEVKSFLDEMHLRMPVAIFKNMEVYISDAVPENELWFVNLEKDKIMEKIKNIKVD